MKHGFHSLRTWQEEGTRDVVVLTEVGLVLGEKIYIYSSKTMSQVSLSFCTAMKALSCKLLQESFEFKNESSNF